MKRKINNPFDPEKNHCFGCGPENPIGLKLDFYESDNEVMAEWEPHHFYQGYLNVLHGGLIATLLDEIAAWFVYVKLETAGLTSGINVKYLHPVHISKGSITVKARLLSQSDRKAMLACTLYDGEGKKCAEAETEFFVFPAEVAEKRYNYPGIGAFKDKDH